MGGFKPFLAYEASAGSGKTFNLVVRYLSLLFMGEDPGAILSLTFTNKAANEMQERIIETLTHLESRDELGVICEVTGLTREEVLSRKPGVLSRYLDADVKVMTLDRFFARILRKFSLHLGIMPSFTTYERQHATKVTMRFLDACARSGHERSLVQLALMASARVSSLFGLLDELYLNAKSAGELHFGPEDYRDVEHRLMLETAELRRAVENHPDASATAKNSMQADSVEALLEKSWIGRPSLEYRTYAKCYTPELDVRLGKIQALLRHYFRAKEANFFHELFALLGQYEQTKLTIARDEAELGFDDITALVYDLLTKSIDRDFLYFRIDSRIRHMLLDEFQDTSTIQFEILQPLIDEIRAGEGAHASGSFFFVGDVKQSIYRFRGGRKELFHTAVRECAVTLEALATNYRSSRHVVEFVNRVFAGKIEGYRPQQVKPDASQGYVEVLDAEAPLEAMLRTVRMLLDAGADRNDIAVLCPTNRDGSEVAAVLQAEGIAVVTETTSKLIAQPKVMALIEYLKYCRFGAEIYRRNFFALIGRSPEPLPTFDLNRFDPAERVMEAIERFGIERDMNLLRFVQMASQYDDAERFVYEYERSDMQAARTEIDGVRVLTVHKSKGLEYRHVVVMDRLKKAPAPRNTILYAYDGLRLRNLYLRQSKRDLVDPEYREAVEQEKALAREDLLNALYVAFTRARETLHVLHAREHSQFETLGLSCERYGECRIEAAEPAPAEPDPVIDYRALRYGSQSELLAEDRDADTDHHAVEFGLAMHYALEMMERFDDGALDAAMHMTLNRFGATLPERDFESIRLRIGRLIASEEFQRLTDGRCRREQPLSFDGQLRYLDLLVEHADGGWTIVDYKSSRYGGEAHRQQVGFYQKAVERITGGAVKAYLCYLLEEEVRIEPV